MTVLYLIIIGILSGVLGLRWNHWRVVKLQQTLERRARRSAEDGEAWLAYEREAENEITRLGSALRSAPTVEALQAANATINELEARLARTPARDRFNRESTGQWARRLITEIREPVGAAQPSYDPADPYAALATVVEENSQEIVIERQKIATAAPVRTYPAKRARRRKRRR